MDYMKHTWMKYDEITYPRSYEIRFDDFFLGPLIHEVPVYNFCRPLGISVGRYVKNRLHRGLAWPSCRHELLFARNPQLICDPLHSHGGHGSMSHVLSKWKSEAQMIFHSNSAMRLPFFWSASMSAMFVRFPIQQWFEFDFPSRFDSYFIVIKWYILAPSPRSLDC